MSCGSSCACSSAGPGIALKPIVSVNGRIIPQADIDQEAQHHPAKTPAEAWDKAARALVLRELLLERAHAHGLVAAPNSDALGRTETPDEALLRAVIETEVHVPVADDAVCRRYYQKNSGRFQSADIFEASHILIAADKRDLAAYQRAGDRAAALRSDILNDRTTFENAARHHSDCSSRNMGGALGQITAGDTTPEFEAALLALDVGAMSVAPVASRYGFHIVRLDRHIPGAVMPFEAVQTHIAAYLDESVHRRAMAQYAQVLLASAKIQGIEIPNASGPLVQ